MKINYKTSSGICILLWLTSVLLYLPSLTFEFINFDDYKILLGNPHLYNNDILLDGFIEIFIKDFPREEPLLIRDLTWAIDSRIFGFKNPFGYHLGNVLLNAFNVVLLFLFLKTTTKKTSLSLAIAMIFACLPVHVEPVCWVMGRKDLLVAFFTFLCLLLQAASLETKERSIQYFINGLLSVFYLFAILSKFSAITLFLVLAAYRLFWPYLSNQVGSTEPFHHERIIKQVLLPAIPHLFISLIVYAWYNYNLAEIGVITNRGPGPLTFQHISTLFQFLPWVLMLYIKHVFWPSQLSIFYTWPNAGIPLTVTQITVGTFFIFLFFICIIKCFIYRKDLFFYLAAFIFFILPYCNVVYIGIWVANRYVYIASFCLIALLCHIGSELLDRFSTPAKLKYLIVIIYCCILTLQTIQWMMHWKNDFTLWKHEAYLESPSLFSIESLTWVYVFLSQQTQEPNKREFLIQKAEKEINRGISRYQELKIQNTNYVLYENISLSRIYSLRATVAKLRDASLAEQLQWYLKAYSIAKEVKGAEGLWKTYYHLAETSREKESEEYIRLSFKYFLDYVYLSLSPHNHQKMNQLLTDQFENRFPYLANEIKEARKKYFQ